MGTEELGAYTRNLSPDNFSLAFQQIKVGVFQYVQGWLLFILLSKKQKKTKTYATTFYPPIQLYKQLCNPVLSQV